MSKGFLFDILDGFGHILAPNGSVVKVPAKRLPKGAAAGSDVHVVLSKNGHAHVAPVETKKNKTTGARARQQYAMQRLMSPGHGPNGKGWSAAQASGIVGRFMVEAYDHLDTNARGDLSIPGASVGIGQWNRERKQALIKYSKQHPGGAPNNFDTQLDFFDYEIMNSPRERLARLALLAAKTPRAAGTAMMHYERPGGYTPSGPSSGNGYQRTIQNANSLMAQYDPSYKPDVDTGTGGDPGWSQADPTLDSGDEIIPPPDMPQEDQETMGELVGDQFQTDMMPSGGEEDTSTQEEIWRMMLEGQQAQQGNLPGLPGLPNLRSVFGQS